MQIPIEVLRRELRLAVAEVIMENQNALLPKKRESVRVPLSIFRPDAGILEMLVYYMRNKLEMTYKDIADALHRDNKVIWNIYDRISRKKPLFPVSLEDYVGLNVFVVDGLTCFEAVVLNLKDRFRYSFSRIAELLGRNYQTVWVTYKRAKKKVEI